MIASILSILKKLDLLHTSFMYKCKYFYLIGNVQFEGILLIYSLLKRKIIKIHLSWVWHPCYTLGNRIELGCYWLLTWYFSTFLSSLQPWAFLVVSHPSINHPSINHAYYCHNQLGVSTCPYLWFKNGHSLSNIFS